MADRGPCLADALLQRGAAAEPPPAGSGGSCLGAAGMTHRPAPCRKHESTEVWRDFLSEIQTVGQGWSGWKRQRRPCANKELLLLLIHALKLATLKTPEPRAMNAK